MADTVKVLHLHHSTGMCVWKGGVPGKLAAHNAEHGTDYRAEERAFPTSEPYGWKNYPYDYWNIWVNHAGDEPFMEQPTLEMLTNDYDVISWKHCFPVSHVLEDTGNPDVGSEDKRLENYRLQYAALKEKMRRFADTKFIVWTPAALVASVTGEDEGRRTREFAAWVKDEWDEPGDNIFVWDFFELETEGGLFLKSEYAAGEGDSHPNAEFSARVAPCFAQRIVDVIEGRGDSGNVTGT